MTNKNIINEIRSKLQDLDVEIMVLHHLLDELNLEELRPVKTIREMYKENGLYGISE